MLRHHLAGLLVAALGLLATSCGKELTGFDGGVEPLEVPADAPSEWPPLPTTPGPVAIVTGSRIDAGSAYSWAHGRVLLAAPIADVWGAVQWRRGVLTAVYPDIPTVECEPVYQPEAGFELSYGVKETPIGSALHRANWFLVFWRGATARDAAQAVTGVNLKAQKVDGTSYIPVMRESVVATPAPGGGTLLEIVRHINAPDESPTTAGDWIRLWVDSLGADVAGTPLLPASTCFP